MTAQLSIAPEAPDEALVMAYDFVAVLSLWPPDHPPMVTCGLCGLGQLHLGRGGLRRMRPAALCAASRVSAVIRRSAARGLRPGQTRP